MKKAILFCAVAVLSAFNLAALDLTTVDGKVFKNVTITNVLPNSVGFTYTEKDGTYVVRDIPLTSLTENLQKKFNYSPKKAKEFEEQVAKFQEARQKLLAKYQSETNALFQQQKLEANELNNIKALLYAHRIQCYVHIVRALGENCIAKVDAPQTTDKYGQWGTFYIRNLTGSQNLRMAATIYPTGETKAFEDGVFPVYDADLNGYALQILKEQEEGKDLSPSTQGPTFPVNTGDKK